VQVKVYLTLTVFVLFSTSCLLASRAMGISEARIILAPVTSDEVSAESLVDAREKLQARLNGNDLLGRATVIIEDELIRIDLTNREDIELVLNVCVTQGILIFFNSDEPLPEGSSVPENPTVILSDQDITAAYVSQDSLGQYIVALAFIESGSKQFADYTRDNIGRYLVIALDGVVISSPRVQSEVSGGEAVIQGNFTKENANQFASLLRNGRIPFPLTIVDVSEE